MAGIKAREQLEGAGCDVYRTYSNLRLRRMVVNFAKLPDLPRGSTTRSQGRWSNDELETYRKCTEDRDASAAMGLMQKHSTRR